jgi:hypothetical protein
MCTFDDDCDDGHSDDGDYDKDAKCNHADACDRVYHDQGVHDQGVCADTTFGACLFDTFSSSDQPTSRQHPATHPRHSQPRRNSNTLRS